MAGLLPSICGAQNVNANGIPLAGAVLTVYQGGTLTLANVFQDIGLAIPAQNPMTADATGRLAFFYLADGTYRARLVDATGVLIYDYLQLASIGASSSGGGGSAVDPTAIFQTGDPIWTQNPTGGTRSGWVRMNALTIGSATSGASELASSTCQNLFLHLWNNYPDTKCPVVGGRGSTAAADWAANKQITLPNMRGKGPFGCDGMGNSRANIIPDTNVTSGGGDTGDTPAAFGGEANHLLTIGQIPAHGHSVNDIGHAHGTSESPHHHAVNVASNDFGHIHNTSDPGHPHNIQMIATATGSGFNAAIGTGLTGSTIQLVQSNTTGVGVQSGFTNIPNFNSGNATTGLAVNSNVTGITVQSTGGGATHNTMSPFTLGTWYQKL